MRGMSEAGLYDLGFLHSLTWIRVKVVLKLLFSHEINLEWSMCSTLERKFLKENLPHSP